MQLCFLLKQHTGIKTKETVVYCPRNVNSLVMISLKANTSFLQKMCSYEKITRFFYRNWFIRKQNITSTKMAKILRNSSTMSADVCEVLRNFSKLKACIL